ncbi:tRNA/tmRNA/rRNA uracil-C5-methylase (TrmA/RlmC/RlmD family) [Bifidobacterium commune]|uniref:tRNA/tmRNA/rRNA uracil-C5-methylase, TrmA/RlmC/RlmD family n=1 Tax=Bifidobacterium commune TaxID=1505727 RepID=A0A1C4H0D4_9BIFI|nr:TRAM domain-containing protein [Bifidobacterium commune]MBB2955338.1 tRNA/tmRNA/rRNA uracil-C5-methylase (TrmA/RlmC/RlmD family) [Bifidobacterium commune]SCC78326.1 tRNA/tmRNA/rRNA uracil-C5-methylase, TrmA/RlmC/RlmD family [Bifidobacterium commune]
MQATVRIERYADQGRCVAHIDGRVVFVRFALPGELVTIELDEPYDRDDRFWTAEVVDVLEPSEDRVEPLWPLAGPLAQGGGVGGADLIHVSLPGQLKWKSALITDQMRRMGHLDIDDVSVARMDDDVDEKGLHWRTRIELIADEEGHASMRRRASHTRVRIDTMPLATRALLAVARNQRLWNEQFEPGAKIRIAVPEPRDIHTSRVSNKILLDTIGDNFAITVDGRLYAGSKRLKEVVDVDAKRYKYGVEAGGFWQVHRMAAPTLVKYVLGLVSRELSGVRSAAIWDLFSGSGLFTVPLAKTFTHAKLLSVEGGRIAVRNAERNLHIAKSDNVTALQGDTSRRLRNVPEELAKPNVVVLDPPRAGAKAQVCRQIAEAGTHAIVYIACDPTSLARDAATLTSLGYRLKTIQAFDIYPMTHHVETVALFVREYK